MSSRASDVIAKPDEPPPDGKFMPDELGIL